MGVPDRLGGKDPRAARIRVVAATNRDLTPMLDDGRFRTDLYRRIATWVVELPPLRMRRADIPNLAAFFLAREAETQTAGGDVSAAAERLGISRATLYRRLKSFDIDPAKWQ